MNGSDCSLKKLLASFYRWPQFQFKRLRTHYKRGNTTRQGVQSLVTSEETGEWAVGVLVKFSIEYLLGAIIGIIITSMISLVIMKSTVSTVTYGLFKISLDTFSFFPMWVLISLSSLYIFTWCSFVQTNETGD